LTPIPPAGRTYPPYSAIIKFQSNNTKRIVIVPNEISHPRLLDSMTHFCNRSSLLRPSSYARVIPFCWTRQGRLPRIV
jgi:hypothetical protein